MRARLRPPYDGIPRPVKSARGSVLNATAIGYISESAGAARAPSSQAWLYCAGSEGTHLAEGIEITIVVGDRQSVPQGACRDQTVDSRPNGHACTTGCAVQLDRFIENFVSKRRLDNWQCEHRVASDAEGPFIAKALQYLLHDGEAGHDLFDVRHGIEAQNARLAEHFHPHRGVNENHAPVAASAEPGDRLSSRRGFPPRAQTPPTRESGGLARAARIHLAPGRPRPNRSAPR
jgi:hypothetical protein